MLSLVVLTLAWEGFSGRHVAGAADLVPRAVQDQAAASGWVRVLVEVRLPTPFRPEGQLSTIGEVVAQRASVAFAQSQILSRLLGVAHTVAHRYETAPYLALEVDADALRRLQALPFFVQRVIEDTLHGPLLVQSVPIVEGNQAWASGMDGTGSVIAVIDTGVDKTHPFLAGKVVEEACFSTTVGGANATTSLCPNGQAQQLGAGAGVNCPSNVNFCWHGTHVAGIAAGNGAGAGVGFSGVAKNAQIMAVQVFSRSGSLAVCGFQFPCATAWQSDILAGFERVYTLRDQHNFAAVNLSVGRGRFTGHCDSDPAKPFIDNLLAVGIPTVAASGNEGTTSQMSAPACVSTAVSVGSTDKQDHVSAFSNVGPELLLFAPGDGIFSSSPGSAWRTSSGTSMAAPHVSGAFAILRQASPGGSVSDLLAALEDTGVLVTDDRLFGELKPRIRIAAALATLPPTAPPSSAREFKDFNNDGNADILWRHTSGTVAVWLLDGLGFVGSRVFDGIPNEWAVVGAGDFNGDGEADILWRHTSGLVAVWLLDGQSITATQVYTGVPLEWTVAGVGDVSGDGKADIIWRHTSGAVSVWLLDGINVTSTGSPGSGPTDWAIATIGDFDGDSRTDILWQHTSGAVAVWLLNGTNLAAAGALGTRPAGWSIAGVGDFNGDGNADVVWRHTSGTVDVWLLDGVTLLDSETLVGPSTEWTLEGIGDFNGDGKGDMLWRHTSGTVAVWLFNGTTFTVSGEIGAPPTDWQIQ